MPFYEYRCRKCGERFTKVLTLKEHDQPPAEGAGGVACPQCRSRDVEQTPATFSAVTARKS